MLLIVGLGLGFLSYFIFSGFKTASFMTSMAGISGSMIALQSLGMRNGFLYQIVNSLTARVMNGVRVPDTGRIKSLLGGVAGGFAAATVVALFLNPAMYAENMIPGVGNVIPGMENVITMTP